MRLLRYLANSTNPNSLASKLRRQRFRHFLRLLGGAEHATILDIGGWEEFWEIMGFANTSHQITLLNLFEQPTRNSNMRYVLGDARNLSRWGDKAFDVVFSNSVIEHLQTREAQFAMAREAARTGKKVFVQTPSFWFPLEPHFLFPCFHWLPRGARVWLTLRFTLGHYPRAANRGEAEARVDEVRLLRKWELAEMFPGARVVTERFLGLPKSYMVITEGD